MIDVLGWMFNESCINEDVIVDLQDVPAVVWCLGPVPLNRRPSINQLTRVLENQGVRLKEG
jgi:hypothetical protein